MIFHRTRRLRAHHKIRDMLCETRLNPSDFIYPLFIEQGHNIITEIASMPNIFRYSLDTIAKELDEVVALNIPAVLLFGIVHHKDEIGSAAFADDGIIPQAIRFIKQHYPRLFVITDICFCEYTSHGHCGTLQTTACGVDVDNDRTLENIAKQALAHARAGADMLAPSGMIDGMIYTMRTALDRAGFVNLPIMSYAVKYASAFYGPFRDAADSTPAFGDRTSYQMNPANRLEALREAQIDEQEMADVLMVKPALSYLDIIREVKNQTTLPLACYNVSGEYAMIKAASALGYIDGERVMMESLLSMKRSGADMIISYFAKEAVRFLQKNA